MDSDKGHLGSASTPGLSHDEGYPGPSNEPCVMGYLVQCPHMHLSRVLSTGEHHACFHFPRCARSVFIRTTPQPNEHKACDGEKHEKR